MFKLSTRAVASVCITGAVIASTVAPGLAGRSHADAFSLTVFTHLTAPEAQVIQQYANGWAGKNGGTVKVVLDTGSFQSFSTLSRSGKGPDVMFGLPDDNSGTFQLAGLLAPVPSGIYNPDEFVPAANRAVTFNGQAYAVPLMLDTYTLVYNKKLIKSPPKTFTQLIAMAKNFPNTKSSTYGFLYDITNFFYAYAFIRGFGGYIFQPTSGGYNTNNIGLDNSGSVAALTFFKSLITSKLIPSDIDGNTATSLFQHGKLAMFIDGDWDISANRKALGSAFGAAPLPTLPNGGTLHPFEGVQVAFVNTFSHNKDLAFNLIKYLVQNIEIPDFNASGRLPAKKADLRNPAINNDPVLSAYAVTAAQGDPLPNIPEMSAVWTPGANGIKLVVTGKSSPATAAANMVTQIKQGIAQLTQ